MYRFDIPHRGHEQMVYNFYNSRKGVTVVLVVIDNPNKDHEFTGQERCNRLPLFDLTSSLNLQGTYASGIVPER